MNGSKALTPLQMAFSRLNREQQAAVVLPEVSSLILAGAGSGKTSVLTTRIAALVSEEPVIQVTEGDIPAHNLRPNSILAVTFTNKAADEMRGRLRRILGNEIVEQMWIGTFHSICLKMLRIHHNVVGIGKYPLVLDENEQENVIKSVLNLKKEELADRFNLEKDETPSARKIVEWINSHKEHGHDIQDINIDSQSPKDNFMLEVFREYRLTCKRQDMLDYSDILFKARDLLLYHPEVRENYHKQFNAILIDEFQDTNRVQYEWLRLISGKRTFLMAVGDDDQSIYGFRGANLQNMTDFVKDFAGDRIIRLERNYRSKPYILDAANAVIANNKSRMHKKLWTTTEHQKGDAIRLFDCETDRDEAEFIARTISRLIKPDPLFDKIQRPAVPASEIVVLYRSNQQSRLLEEACNRYGIPVIIYGGIRFYERMEIKRMLAYLDLMINPDRDVSFKQAISFPLRGIGQTTLNKLEDEARAAGISMVERIIQRSELPPHELGNANEQKKQKILERFVEMIIGFSEMAQSRSLAETAKVIIDQSGIRTYLSEEADKAKNSKEHNEIKGRIDNLTELVNAISQFEQDHPELKNGIEVLPEFLSHVQLMISTTKSSINAKNCVSLMTIHAAKGLEFDYVFLAGMEQDVFPSKHATIEEERRLMYVAITRAKSHLILTKARLRRYGQEMNNTSESQFIREIPNELLIRKTLGSTNVIYLDVPFPDKDIVKKLGARWDAERKQWYFDDPRRKTVFAKWIPRQTMTKRI